MTWRPVAAPPPPGLQMMRYTQPPQGVIAASGGTVTDPYFSSVQLLLHADGADGSTTLIDSSSAGRVITVNGAAKLSTAQAKFGPSAIAFDGSSAFLTISGTDLATIPGDLTVETWAYFTGTPSTAQDIIGTNRSGTNTNGWVLRRQASGVVTFEGSTTGSNNIVATGPSTPSVSAWHHLAGVKRGANLFVFIDGVGGSAAALGGSQFDTGVVVTIGRNPTNSSWFYQGYLDDIRVTKGVARYGNFVPPTSAFPNS